MAARYFLGQVHLQRSERFYRTFVRMFKVCDCEYRIYLLPMTGMLNRHAFRSMSKIFSTSSKYNVETCARQLIECLRNKGGKTESYCCETCEMVYT